MTPRHLILDRDGVLNHEASSGWISSAAEWRWLPGVLGALRSLHEAGVRVSVVTNQSCIGRGLATRQQVDAVHERMMRECRAAGGSIDAVFVCPHAPGDGCDCRKPRSGLVRQAVTAAGLAAGQTLLVGDDQRDLEAGRGGGVRIALVRTGKGVQTEASLGASDVPVYDDLRSAVSALLERTVRRES
jgi:D-glycero-D-manno-heptose 1,7-bisphosphate phosphatase